MIGRDDLASKENLKCKSYVVCSKHFDSSQFRVIRLLNNNALPKVENTQSIEEPTPDSSKNEGSSKRKLSDKSTTYEDKRRRLLDSAGNSSPLTKDPIYINTEESDNVVTNKIHQLIKWQNELKKKGGEQAKYKMFAIDLLIYSPQAYQCLKTALNLPNKNALIGYKLNIPPNFDDKVLHRLKVKLNSLPIAAKYCIICIDKFPLKSKLYYDTKADEITGFHCINERKKTEMAKNAYVIMIQGIFYNWQQPVAYALLGDGEYYEDLDTWLNNVICKLSGIGIEVKAIASDNSPYFENFAKGKNVTEVNPYISYNNKAISYIFDVHHLMLSIRNYLLKGDLSYGSQKISWDYIKMLYQNEAQKERSKKLVPKLTDCHIEPGKKDKMNVQLALETFSRTVSVALHTYIDFGQLPEEARPTAHFIETLNNLFDLLNSSKVKCKNEIQSALRMTQDQIKFVKEATEMLANIKSSTAGAELIEHFQITITSIKTLYNDLTNNEFEYVLTGRLNKDCVTTFYKVLISQNNYRNLTPIQFRRGFSKLFLRYLIKNSSTCTSYGLDLCDALKKVEDVQEFGNAPEPSPVSGVALGPETDYQMDLPDFNTLVYVSSFLLFKCTKKHKCPSFGRFWDSCRSLSDSNLFPEALNEKAGYYCRLKIPPKEFIRYIQNLETNITKNMFRLIKKSPGSQLFKLLKTVPAKVPCSCFPLSYLLKLFVRFRIYQTLKFNNSGKNSDKKFLKIKHL